MVAFDDIHWGEATFLDLVEYLWGWSTGFPILLLCSARPDLLDVRPAWGSGNANVDSIRLDPLTPEESDLVIENLVAGAELDREVRARISEVAEGNPLFVEEILRMLVDEGLLRRDDGRWIPVGDLASFDIPPTINALLDARLEGIPGGERAVLQRASVMGKLFSWAAVSELSPDEDRPLVGTHLQALVRRAMIHPERAEFAGEDGFAFGHILIRDAAYRGVPKETRAKLHRRFARWLESKAGDAVEEYEEVIGYHLEQSCRYRSELGPLGELINSSRTKGPAAWLRPVGERSPGAMSPPRSISSLEPWLCSTMTTLFGSASCPTSGRRSPKRGLPSGQETCSLRLWSDPRPAARTAFEHTPPCSDGSRWVRVTSRTCARRRSGRSRCSRPLGTSAACPGHCEPWAKWTIGSAGSLPGTNWDMERALGHARKAEDAREQAEIFSILSVDLNLGQTPALEGIQRCEELLAEEGGNRTIAGSIFHTLAHLRAMRGEFDEALTLAERFRAILRDNGAMSSFWFFAEVPFHIKMLAGEPDEAVKILTEAYERLEQMGEASPILAGLLSHALYATDRLPEARQQAELASRGDVRWWARGELNPHVLSDTGT